MPLKHRSETALFFLLASSIALFGIALSVIPSPSVSLLPFALLFFLGMIYPLSLRAYLRFHRADYELRVLHYYPVAMVLFVALLARLSSVHPLFTVLLRGASLLSFLPLILFAFVLLAFFAVHVLRRFVLRLFGLMVLFSFYLTIILSPSSSSFLQDARHFLASPQEYHRATLVPKRVFEYGTSLFSALLMSPEQEEPSSRSSASLSSSRPSSLAHSGPLQELALLLLLFPVLLSGALHRRWMRAL